jgi:hypothetical protein
MRILSLGFPMPGPPVDNHSFASAPSFFDYDALVVDPKALSQLIEEIADGSGAHTTRSGDRVVNGPSGPGMVGLADLLRDRRDETARLLARGGVAVCLAYPNVVHERVAGFADCDRYCWLPAPDGLRYADPFLRRGHGTLLCPATKSHPFAPFLTRFQGRLAYQAYFDDAPCPPHQVLARSPGGAAIALEIAVGAGSVVFLPPPARPLPSDERYEASYALQEAIRETLRLASSSASPYWLSEYQLPGLVERITAREEAKINLAEAETRLAASDDALEELERFRRLLWQEGRYGLEDGVRAACALLGFQVYPQELDQPAQIALTDDRHNQRVALLEVDASEEAVGLDGHYRLRQRLEEVIAQGKPARGALIINGYRRTPPSERPPQYDETLRAAAERLRYCVATTEQLFHAVRAALEGDETTVHAFRERLLTTEGVLQQD